MAIDVELKTSKQNNTTWPSTFKASNRFPIVANRVFATLEKAQQYVDDTAADASAYVGIVLAVVQDETAKNNGVYYVSSVAMSEGEKGTLVKVGGTETETAEDYSKAVELSKTLVVGQLIKVEKEYKENAGEENEIVYQKGFYIVEGSGKISALSTSTGADDEVGALKARVDSVEGVIGDAEGGLVKKVADLEAIDHDAYIAADDKLKEELQGEIAGKVAQDAYDTKMGELDIAIAGKVAQGDYDAKVQELEGAISAESETRASAVTELTTAVNDKVAKDVYEAKVADFETRIAANTTKLAGIEENAEVNVIEVVKVNGTALTVADSDRSVDITIPTAPVQGVATGEKLISLDGDKLKSTLTIAYVAASKDENGEHVPSQLRLQGIGGDVISSINADQFVKDGMIEKVEVDGPQEGETGKKYLVITWNTESGKDVMRLDVSEIFNPYEAENGVQLSGNTFSLKLATGEQYLTVTDGLATTEALWNKVIELDNTNLASAKEYADGVAATAQSNAESYADGLASNYDAAGAAADALTAATAYADEKLVEAKGYADDLASNYDAAGAAADALTAATAYADEKFVTKEGFNEFEAEYEEKLNGIAAGAEVNVIEKVVVNDIEATIENKVAALNVEAKDIKLGAAITADEEEVYGSDATISTVLQGIQDSVTAAVSGSLTGVVGGDGIEVSDVNANKQTVSVKVDPKEGNLLTASNDGLFVAMYYDGDDAE